MSDLYWLPCECGQRHRVGARQAGQRINCSCGKMLDVPTLGGLAELELAEPPDDDAAPTAKSSGENWSLRQSGMFLGLLMLIGGLGWAAYLEANKPTLFPIEQMEPLQTWGLWQELRTGADRFASPQAKAYSLAVKQNRAWLTIALVIAGGGLLVIVGTYALIKPPPDDGA